MTTISSPEVASDPPRAEVLAQRVRGMISERRARGGELALALGMSRSAFSRRLAAETDFTPNEVQRIAAFLETSEQYLYGFTDDRSPRRTAPGGGSLFFPIEGGGTASGTRTPNPLISGERPRHLRLILGAQQPRVVTPEPIPVPASAVVTPLAARRRHLALVDTAGRAS